MNLDNLSYDYETKNDSQIESNFVTISINDVPEWLRDSEIYRNFEEGEGEFQLDSKYIVSTPNIETPEDFKKVMYAYTFWCVDKIPYSVFEFAIKSKILDDNQSYSKVKNIFSNYYVFDKLDIFVNFINDLVNQMKYRKNKGQYHRINLDIFYLSQINTFIKIVETFCDTMDISCLADFKIIHLLIEELAIKGHTDCIHFCLSLFEEKKKKMLLDYHLFTQKVVNDSKLDLNKKIEVLDELKNLGFSLPHTSSVQFYTEENIQAFIWLHKNGSKIDIDTLRMIVSEKFYKPEISVQLHNLFKYCIDSGVEISENEGIRLLKEACKLNDIESVKILIRICPCDVLTFRICLVRQHIEIMELLCDFGFELNIEDMYEAVRYGFFESLKFLHRRGCPWNANVFQIATAQREIVGEECLQYLIDNNCPRE